MKSVGLLNTPETFKADSKVKSIAFTETVYNLRLQIRYFTNNLGNAALS